MLGIVAEEGKHINPNWIQYFTSNTVTLNGINSNNSTPIKGPSVISNGNMIGAGYDYVTGAIQYFEQSFTGAYNYIKQISNPTSGDYPNHSAIDIMSDGTKIISGLGAGGQGSDTKPHQIIKISANGLSIVWNVALNDEWGTYPYIQWQTVDSSGNIYLLVNCNYGSATLGSALIKLNSSGSISWATKWLSEWSGTSTAFNTMGLQTDSSGNVYVTLANYGYFGKILKFNSLGVFQWQKNIEALNPYQTSPYINYVGQPTSMAIDSSGNVYVVGLVRINIPPSTTNSNTAVFLIKFDSSGNIIFNKMFNIAGTTTYVYNYTVDIFVKSSNIYLSCGTSYFVALDLSGSVVYSRNISYSGYALSLDSSNFSDYSNSFSIYCVPKPSSSTSLSNFYIRLPLDGSKLGTYSFGGYNLTYSDVTSSFVEVTPTNVKITGASISGQQTASYSVSTGATATISNVAIPALTQVTIN